MAISSSRNVQIYKLCTNIQIIHNLYIAEDLLNHGLHIGLVNPRIHFAVFYMHFNLHTLSIKIVAVI
jgi:hypothetical protein